MEVNMPEITFFGGLDNDALYPNGPREDHIGCKCQECGDQIYLWDMHNDYVPAEDEIIFNICPMCFVNVLNEHEDKCDQLYMLAGEYPGRRITLSDFRRVAAAHRNYFE